jgi:hypothetical protein
LGGSTIATMFLTLSLEGASHEVLPNRSTRKNKIKIAIQEQPKNVKHRRNTTNENVTHVKNIKHET